MRMMTEELRRRIERAFSESTDEGALFPWDHDEISETMALLDSVRNGTYIDQVDGVTDVQVFYDEPENDDLRDQLRQLINTKQARVSWDGEVLTLWTIVKMVDAHHEGLGLS